MRLTWILLASLMMVGCTKEAPEPDPAALDVTDGPLVEIVPKPNLPGEVASFKDRNHGCVVAQDPNNNTAKVKPGGPSMAVDPGAVQVVSAPLAFNQGALPDPLSVDTDPPAGGDGSFYLTLGGYNVRMPDKSWAVHSHEEPHVLWIADLVKPVTGDPQYRRQAVVLRPGAKVTIQLEQLPKGGTKYVPRGVVTLEQKIVDGYDAQVNALLAQARSSSDFKTKHKITCGYDYAWHVTTSKVRLGLKDAQAGVWATKSILAADIRMASMTIDNKAANKPITIPLGSGCATFQICGRTPCKDIVPKCPTTKAVETNVTWLTAP